MLSQSKMNLPWLKYCVLARQSSMPNAFDYEAMFNSNIANNTLAQPQNLATCKAWRWQHH